ncbi:unnamed protein product [Vicia faba]|uniref:Peroxisomal membrane protein PEX14 n=1 Tax=Vicia faba TaxID=3906 RepID=A0AAV0ZTJ7_VICFA|nr:unnamed protein product [Vicia faba]
MLPREDPGSCSTQLLNVKQEPYEQRGPNLPSTPVDLSFHIGLTGAESVRNIPASSRVEAGDHSLESSEVRPPLKPQPSGTIKAKSEDNHEKLGGCSTSNVADNARAINGNVSCCPNNYRQKGPRIAKVVCRINCNVEPLEFGIVFSGKSRCSSQAIFPKGFRIRVRYINILDPCSTCYYISEILDAGRGSPLFMVSLENSPNEVFIRMSAIKCWDLVREVVSLLDKQIQEMKLMTNAIRRLEGQEDLRASQTSSKRLVVNGKADYDLHSERSLSPPASVEPSGPPHPKSYMEIMAMVQRGEKPSNIREINDLPPQPKSTAI